jgi:pimeloyl-ACP methyl ester carboxylesterase
MPGTVAVAGSLLGACSTAEESSSPEAPPTGVRPTIVLVHGAWADTSSWNGEVDALRKQGYDARAVANPLENLTTDSQYVSTFLKTLTGPIVLVGHSYGAQ